MSTIDLKLKTYQQLQFEITKLNTGIFLKDKEIKRLNNIIKEVREYIEEMQIWLVNFEDFGITTKGLLQILDNVEIIEEDKKIEKMIPLNNVSGASDLVAISQMQWENNLKIERKINEIIDKLNSIGE